ncbi:hypothetical protein EGT74_05230 [Chitinophaga lutea]|uniref:Bacterial transcriptional activator domain-containing protein n=2 Tax=Chitinophaga lutea TaxID=2488634 RepID=A0A3N4PYB7_9BACT|nr:hypothetical protein EGT74_05230 [Chitinophaga lutea]
MEKYLMSIFFACLFCSAGFAQSHGLAFSSHEVVPEKRTGLRLTSDAPVCIEQEMDISFDAMFRLGMETYFGYVLGLVTNEGQNIDLVYNQRLFSFNFVIGENFADSFRADNLQFDGPDPFRDIKSFADLFYAPRSRKLPAVRLFNTKDDIRELKAYTLDSPPNPTPAVTVPAQNRFRLDRVLMGLACMLTAGALFYFVWKRWHTLDEAHGPSPAVPPAEDTPEKTSAAIFLFGDFEMTGKEGNDCTRLFTPLLQELFLLLLIYTEKGGKGIAPEKLFELLWGDTSPKDARNNFSMNLVKLKVILEKAGDLHIVKDAGRWKLEVPADVRFDYRDYLGQASTQPSAAALLEITSRGSFLRNMPYEWLDDIKSEISIHATGLMLAAIGKMNLHRETDLVLRLTQAIFQFDPLNEEALVYRCKCLMMAGRHKTAQDAYTKFAKEYRESYGEDFRLSFQDITRDS